MTENRRFGSWFPYHPDTAGRVGKARSPSAIERSPHSVLSPPLGLRGDLTRGTQQNGLTSLVLLHPPALLLM